MYSDVSDFGYIRTMFLQKRGLRYERALYRTIEKISTNSFSCFIRGISLHQYKYSYHEKSPRLQVGLLATRNKRGKGYGGAKRSPARGNFSFEATNRRDVRLVNEDLFSYIIPGIPPPIPAAAPASGLSSFMSVIKTRVVKMLPATEAAFLSASFATLAGSITPASSRSSNSRV